MRKRDFLKKKAEQSEDQSRHKRVNNNDLLANCQSGFRSLHSSLTSLLEATNSWSVNIDNGFIYRGNIYLKKLSTRLIIGSS